MLTKVYISLWLVLAAFAAGVYVTGNLTPMMVVFLGLIVCGMVFMGMMSVLPTAVHDELLKH
jgi:formate/nitrite transporter FocA (FNT family)